MARGVDVIVIGGGIAGVSVAAELARSMKVLLLERESQPGYHATGRSAAYFAPAYGNDVVRLLTQLSDDFYRNPRSDFGTGLLRPRSAVFVATRKQAHALDAMAEADPDLSLVDAEWLRMTVPILNGDVIAAGLHDPGGGDLDVHAILQGYLRQLRRLGGELVTGTEVVGLAERDGRWHVQSPKDTFESRFVVNAAGAWADRLAHLAGVAPVGLKPKRRTALLIDGPDFDFANWPLVIDVEEQFYFKPDAGKLLLSPADETLSEPTDAQPDDFDVAVAIDRFTHVTNMTVEHVDHKWAGLRTFADDKTFVIGFEPEIDGFFWLAGQGGYGVQSAPGVARLAAHLLTGDAMVDGYEAALDCVSRVTPARFRQG